MRLRTGGREAVSWAEAYTGLSSNAANRFVFSAAAFTGSHVHISPTSSMDSKRGLRKVAEHKKPTATAAAIATGMRIQPPIQTNGKEKQEAQGVRPNCCIRNPAEH